MRLRLISFSFLFCCFVPLIFAEPADHVIIIEHGERNSGMVALTFDACPTAKPDEYDEKVIEILLREQVPATIFLSGRWVEKNKARAAFLANQAQFEIAAHSYYHPHMTEKPDDRDMRELKRTQELIRKVSGKIPVYFRPPFGEVDERVARLAADAGLVTVQYDIASGDPDPNLSARSIARGVLKKAQGGSIVVFHMNRNGVHTAEALPLVIEGLRKSGFKLVTVGQLLTRKKDATAEERYSVPENLTKPRTDTLNISYPVPAAPL